MVQGIPSPSYFNPPPPDILIFIPNRLWYARIGIHNVTLIRGEGLVVVAQDRISVFLRIAHRISRSLQEHSWY